MPKIDLPFLQHRRSIGNNTNWQDKKQGDQQYQNKRVEKMASIPGLHRGNIRRQNLSLAILQLFSLITSAGSSIINPAITQRRAGKLNVKNEIQDAEVFIRSQIIESAVRRGHFTNKQGHTEAQKQQSSSHVADLHAQQSARVVSSGTTGSNTDIAMQLQGRNNTISIAGLTSATNRIDESMTVFYPVADMLNTTDGGMSPHEPLISPAMSLNREENKEKRVCERSILYKIKGKVIDLHQSYYSAVNKTQALEFIKTGRESVAKYYEDYSSKYPGIKKLASSLLKDELLRRFHIDIDPDKTCFMHFDNSMYDGNERIHFYPPQVNKTLTQWIFTNFDAETQINLQDMDTMCGIYNISAGNRNEFHSSDEINIKPTDFIQLVWDIDFFNYATTKISESFQNKDKHVKKLFIDFINHLDISDLDNESAEDVLRGAGIKNNKNFSVFLFDIDGYSAANAFVFKNDKTDKMILYFPGSDFKFLSFRGIFEMRSWVTAACATKEHREMIASHFTLANRQDDLFYYGIDAWLNSINQDNDYYDKIAIKSIKVSSDRFFEDLFFLIKDKTLSDIDSLIKSDSEVIRDMWEDMIDASNVLPNPISPFLSLGIHIEHMMEADSWEEKKQEWGKIKNDVVNLVAMVLLDRIIKVDADGYEFIGNIKNGINNIDVEFFYDNFISGRESYDAKLIATLAITPEDISALPENANYYRISVKGSKKTCIKIDGKYLPVRDNNREFVEVYDVKRLSKPGYPVYLDQNNNWRLGFFNPSFLKGRALRYRCCQYLSRKLKKAITKKFFENDSVNKETSSPDSRGIVKGPHGKRYLLYGDAYIRITRHPLLKKYNQLGPDGTDKITCYFDKEKGMFKLVSEKRKLAISKRKLRKKSDSLQTAKKVEGNNDKKIPHQFSEINGRKLTGQEHYFDPSSTSWDWLYDNQEEASQVRFNPPLNKFLPLPEITPDYDITATDQLLHRYISNYLQHQTYDIFYGIEDYANTPYYIKSTRSAIRENIGKVKIMLGSAHDKLNAPAYADDIEKYLSSALGTDNPNILSEARARLNLQVQRAYLFLSESEERRFQNFGIVSTRQIYSPYEPNFFRSPITDINALLSIPKGFVKRDDLFRRIFIMHDANPVPVPNGVNAFGSQSNHLDHVVTHEISHISSNTLDFYYNVESSSNLKLGDSQMALGYFVDSLKTGELKNRVDFKVFMRSVYQHFGINNEVNEQAALEMIRNDPMLQANIMMSNADNFSVYVKEIGKMREKKRVKKNANDVSVDKLVSLIFLMTKTHYKKFSTL